MQNIIEDLDARGLLDNFSNKQEVVEMLKTPKVVYCGFDPSNRSMQLGNFVMISLLRRMQKYGHKVIAILGGATGMIGDPSGKHSERSFQTEEKIIENANCLNKQLSKFIDTKNGNGLILNNYDWWSKTNVIQYLRNYGKYFQVNQMLAKDVVKSRLDVGISYAEFSYALLQSGDFDKLYKDYNCQIQIGGGDQWGNLTSALDYVKRVNKDCKCECFSIKLITDKNGKKFGKSENGALFLDAQMTSPYTLYQYFMNVSDDEVKKYMYIFSEKDLKEIDEFVKKHNEHPELRLGQMTLAYDMVSLIHSKQDADCAVNITKCLFSDSYDKLSNKEIEYLVNSFTETYEIQQNEITLVDALILTKLASSKREAREFIQNHSISINGNKTDSLDYVLTTKDALNKKYVFLKRGKKKYSLLIFR